MGYLYIKLYLFHSICPNLLGILENPIFEGISFNVPLQKKKKVHISKTTILN